NGIATGQRSLPGNSRQPFFKENPCTFRFILD
ncbi:MAG: hypothetical protein JWR60_3777, partial [Polaromonas sp.]|nr:hypothetical protein [Polaromonas sp.]